MYGKVSSLQTLRLAKTYSLFKKLLQELLCTLFIWLLPDDKTLPSRQLLSCIFKFALVSWNLVISSMIEVCGLHLDNFHTIPYVSETKHAANMQHFLEWLFVTVFFLINVYYATPLRALVGKV